MRAAFKVAVTGKQVAVLVPTTAARRAARHHVHYAGSTPHALTRRGAVTLPHTASNARRPSLEGLLPRQASTSLIGTHRLLSKDVDVQADLGLLVIVDEEQRFGVRHKEHLKQAARSSVGRAVSLSATPIPRTLHAVGARRAFASPSLSTPPTRTSRDVDTKSGCTGTDGLSCRRRYNASSLRERPGVRLAQPHRITGTGRRTCVRASSCLPPGSRSATAR